MDCTSPNVFTIDVNENNVEIDQVEKLDEINVPKRNKKEVILKSCFQWLQEYIKKCGGLHENRPNRLSWDEYIWSFFGSLISIVLIGILHYRLVEK